MKTRPLPFCSPRIWLMTSMLLASISICAQLKQKCPGYQENYFQGIRYGFFSPSGLEEQEKYPLIVYLHGSNDTISRALPWYGDAVQKRNPCFVLTPKCEEPDQGWGNTWHSQHSVAAAKTMKLLDSLIQLHPIDRNRLYLYGISMGGFGAFSLLEKEQGLFAAACIVCGGSSEKAARKLLTTPLWIFHGSNDNIVPPHYSRNVYEEMCRLGGSQVRYTTYTGVQHNSWENVAREESLEDWLFAQNKSRARSSAPKTATTFAAKWQQRAVHLSWSKPEKVYDLWYYQLYREGKLIADVDRLTEIYVDKQGTHGSTYELIAVNYFFQKSAPVSIQVP